jgi:hypothetical protein
MVKIAYVAGDVVGISWPSERLAAASENRTLAPHWGQRVATVPTRLPHDGQIFGRGCERPPKNPLMYSYRSCLPKRWDRSLINTIVPLLPCGNANAFL